MMIDWLRPIASTVLVMKILPFGGMLSSGCFCQSHLYLIFVFLLVSIHIVEVKVSWILHLLTYLSHSSAAGNFSSHYPAFCKSAHYAVLLKKSCLFLLLLIIGNVDGSGCCLLIFSFSYSLLLSQTEFSWKSASWCWKWFVFISCFMFKCQYRKPSC